MKHVGLICGILVIIGLFFLLVILGEVLIFEAYPPQLPDTGTTEQQQQQWMWIASFESWARVCVAIAGAASLLWYGLAQWTFKIRNEGKGSEKRVVWGLLFLFPIVAGIVSCILVDRAEKMWIAYLFFILNGLIPYYLATLLFSPASFKYIPWGAKQIRRW